MFSPALLNQLLWKHLMQPSVPPTCSSCFNSTSECFMRPWSFNSHPSNRVSCSLYELKIESSILIFWFWFWACSRVTDPSRARLFLFPIFLCTCFSLSSSFSLATKEVGDGIRSLTLRVNRWVLTPKTTVCDRNSLMFETFQRKFELIWSAFSYWGFV